MSTASCQGTLPAFVVVLELGPKHLSGTGLSRALPCFFHLGHHGTIPPGTWHDAAICVLLVEVCVLQRGVPQPHDLVKYDAGPGDGDGVLWHDGQGCEEAPKSGSQDSEGVLHHSARTGGPVIVDLLVVRQVSMGVGLKRYRRNKKNSL